jgi:hypothetical protein
MNCKAKVESTFFGLLEYHTGEFECTPDPDGFGTDGDFIKMQKARLERIQRQYYDWTAKYSKYGATSAEDFATGLEQLADMSSELNHIHSLTSVSSINNYIGVIGGEALVAGPVESLAGNLAQQYNNFIQRPLPDDLTDSQLSGVRDARWEMFLEAWGMMKGAGIAGVRSIGAPRRVQMMRDTAASIRKHLAARRLTREIDKTEPNMPNRPPVDNARRQPAPPISQGVVIPKKVFTSQDFISEHAYRHRYDPSKKSTKSTTQYGEKIDPNEIRNQTLSNPDEVIKQVDANGIHYATTYKKEFPYNISTIDTPTSSSRVIINHLDAGRSTQFPFYRKP